MRALFKGPSDDKFRELLIPNELDVLQQLVGGYIETLTITTDAVIICNEEGRILGLDPNCNYCGIDFVGPILIVGTDGEEFTDCPMSVAMANKGISSGGKQGWHDFDKDRPQKSGYYEVEDRKGRVFRTWYEKTIQGFDMTHDGAGYKIVKWRDNSDQKTDGI